MTSDHDPRELRAAAEYVLSQSRRGWHSTESVRLADHILATVRDDDGEEQPDTYIFGEIVSVKVARSKQLVWVSIDTGGACDPIPFGSLTRGQFRALCRGLGIVIE